VIDFISKRFLVLASELIYVIKVMRLLCDQSSRFECLDRVLKAVLGSESFYGIVECLFGDTVEYVDQSRSIRRSGIFEIFKVGLDGDPFIVFFG